MLELHQSGPPREVLVTKFAKGFLNRVETVSIYSSTQEKNLNKTSWDDFTSTHHYFRETDLAGVRRIFISSLDTVVHHDNTIYLLAQSQDRLILWDA